MKYIIGNWKMNPKSARDAVALASGIAAGSQAGSSVSAPSVIVCPPFPYLPVIKANVENLELGAQDISPFSSGAYTGQVSGGQLKDLGVKYVIVGHSETREYSNVSEEDIKAKLSSAASAGIMPILCVGAGLTPQDDDAKIKSVVRRQTDSALNGFLGTQILIAYEPTWAISSVGGGKMPTPEHVYGIAEFIRALVREHEHIGSAAVLYGGSVNSHNVSQFKNMDGFLVGSASLDAHEFTEIVRLVSTSFASVSE